MVDGETRRLRHPSPLMRKGFGSSLSGQLLADRCFGMARKQPIGGLAG
jgi:hypothetical protein